jgi:hypothetical protein
MLESISQELPEDIRASLSSVYGLDTLYAPIKHALSKLRSRPAIEKKKADAEHAMTGAQSRAKSHKDTLANLQASYDRLVWYSKRLPGAAGQFPSNNIQCSWCDCETSEHLNALIDV